MPLRVVFMGTPQYSVPVLQRIVDDGHEVVALDNLFTGRKLNIAHLMDHAKMEFIRKILIIHMICLSMLFNTPLLYFV